MASVTTDQHGDNELSEEARRLNRMKHLRVDDFTFANMVPLLIAEGLISEHHDHERMRALGSGRRSEQRNAEICRRCEDMIVQQWKRNVRNLSADEASMLDARFIWTNQAMRRAILCESLAVQKNVEIVTEKLGFPPLKEGEQTPKEMVVIERTVRTETRLYPEMMRMAIDLRRDIAKLAGVPVGQVSSVPKPESETSGTKQRVLRYHERDDAGDTASN